MKRLIVTGDDFGLAVEVNKAIEEGHRQGILTCASLMTGAPAAADAAERARGLPTLHVGLHVVLAEGRAVLPPSAVPDLVDGDGSFRNGLARAGFGFFFLPRVRRQMEEEVRAQFEAFERTGLPLDHVNGHNHLHVHPTVLGAILKAGRQFGLRAIRVPREPFLRSWRAVRRRMTVRAANGALLTPWTWLLRHRARAAGLRCNDYLLGLSDSGAMDEPLVLRLARALPQGVTEMYFHPATSPTAELERAMPGYRHRAEFEALTSVAVRRALEAEGVQRTAFSEL